MEYKELIFDTEFFGYKVVRLEESNLILEELEKIIKELFSQGVRLVYWFVDPLDDVSNQTAKAANLFLADKKVTYLQPVNKEKKYLEDSKNIKSYLKKPINDRLTALALQSGYCSRFKVDPKFNEQDFKRLYKEWMVNSLNQKLAKDVLVYLADGKEAGVITLGEKEGRCDIGLLAVDKEFRGEGIGKILMQAAFEKAKEWDYSEMQVVTQKDNLGACKFYEKCGFKIDHIENIYHLWLN